MSIAEPILITGASGFIGRAVVARCLAAGVPPGRIRCLVRDPARAVRLGLPHVSCVAGALEDAAALRAAARGVEAVVHLAGVTRALRAAELQVANEQGTGRLAAAVADVAPGARFVHVSSLAAAGPSVDGRGTDAPPDRCRPCSLYGASKLGGERRMLEHSPRLDWCVVRPPIVYGPGDGGTRLLLRQSIAPVAFAPWRRRPLSLIHVDDLAAALLLAVQRLGVHGFVPVEGPERSDTDALIRALAAACGRVPRIVRVPMAAARAVARLADVGSLALNRPSFFNADKMREASAPGWVVAPHVARERLGFEPTIGLGTGLRDTARVEGFAPSLSQPATT